MSGGARVIVLGHVPPRRRILLIDDSPLTLDLTSSVLTAAQFDVRTSSDVGRLRELLGGWQPDVILADVNMPGMTGPELCRALKSTYETAHVPVVLFSVLPAHELAELARECDADGYLSKADLETLPGELTHLISTALF